MPEASASDLVVQPAAGGEQPQRLLRVGREPLDPQHQRVAQRRRQRAAAVRARPPAAPRRTAGCPPSARTGATAGRRPGALPRMSVSCSASSSRVSGLQLDAAGAGVALELGQQRAQRVAAVQLVGAVGGDDEHALAAQRAREVDEEGARRAVGPVQVLDRDQQAVVAREQLQQLEQAVEQARLRGRLVVAALARAEAGEDLGERAAGGVGELRRTPGRRRAPAGAARRRSARRAARPPPARRSRRRSRACRRRAPRARARPAAASCRRRTRRPRTRATGGRRRPRPARRAARRAPRSRPTKRRAGHA